MNYSGKKFQFSRVFPTKLAQTRQPRLFFIQIIKIKHYLSNTYKLILKIYFLVQFLRLNSDKEINRQNFHGVFRMNTQETNKTMIKTTNFQNESKFKTNWEKELHQENVKVFKKIFGEKDLDKEQKWMN